MPYSEHIDDGIFVLRAILEHDITRVFYFFVDGGKAILTHGFYKDTQKEPRPKIERAKKYRSFGKRDMQRRRWAFKENHQISTGNSPPWKARIF